MKPVMREIDLELPLGLNLVGDVSVNAGTAKSQYTAAVVENRSAVFI